MRITNFYKHGREEIADIVRSFLDEDLFLRFPELRGRMSVVITGSVSTSRYDKYSDIDLEAFVRTPAEQASAGAAIREYKKTLWKRKVPVQFHPVRTYSWLQKEVVGDWNKDAMLRDYAYAIPVVDPDARFVRAQARIGWYPRPVFREKIRWLYAESVFLLDQRLKIAVQRRNRLYAVSLVLRIAKHLLVLNQLLARRYPSYEKHLYPDVVAQAGLPKGFMPAIDRMLSSRGAAMITETRSALRIMERVLLRRRLIPKRETRYWVLLRPAHKVEIP